MFINKNLKETAYHYCNQWSGVDDQKIDFSIISMGFISHTIYRLPQKEMTAPSPATIPPHTLPSLKQESLI